MEKFYKKSLNVSEHDSLLYIFSIDIMFLIKWPASELLEIKM